MEEGIREAGMAGSVSWQASQKGLQIGATSKAVGLGGRLLGRGRRWCRLLITNQEITLSAWQKLRHSQKLLARPVL